MSAIQEVRAGVSVMLDLAVPMQDGVKLSADVYLPAGDGPFPTLLCRTKYGKQSGEVCTDLAYLQEWVPRFLGGGYAAVMQDCRGRYDSGGEFVPYIHEASDGADTLAWLASQPWCDGNIGMFGQSYVAFTQLQAALSGHPSLRGILPVGNQEDNFGYFLMDGGVLQLQNFVWGINAGRRTMNCTSFEFLDVEALYRHMPLKGAVSGIFRPAYWGFLDHPTFDESWQTYGLKDKYGMIETPAHFVTGWYDNLSREVFKAYTGLKRGGGSAEARDLTRIIIGPWSHDLDRADRNGDIDLGPGVQFDLPGLHLNWYDRRLKGIDNGVDREPPVRIYVMGDAEWRSENEWPLARTDYRRLYLHGGGDARSLSGTGSASFDPPADEPADRFVYDPENPVPTLGGCDVMLDNAGPKDRSKLHERTDVLVYTSKPLDGDLEVTGPVTMTLYAASSAPDTDFTATLCDVHPDGRAIIVCEGIRRARYRDSVTDPALMAPGTPYEFTIDMWQTSQVFKAGHRLRVEVSSSNFPRFDRNPNMGGELWNETSMQPATQTVFHDRGRPSHVLLPVIPR
ncbi:MAG: CocE/NonD family hydrolase [Acidimicrobiia bacterium]|nr:CocE/NonD family hydrolase [Acidimicrobiia bacterium]